jgi:hypothetical protein
MICSFMWGLLLRLGAATGRMVRFAFGSMGLAGMKNDGEGKDAIVCILIIGILLRVVWN